MFFDFIRLINLLFVYILECIFYFLFYFFFEIKICICYFFMVYNKLKNRFNYILNGCYFVISDFLLLPDESTYYLFSFFYDFYFFCYLFLFDHIVHCFIYLFFILFIFFFAFFKFLIFGKLFFYFLFYFFFVFVLIFDFFSLCLFFILINFLFYLFERFLKIPFAGLIFLSKDFLTIEDEDLWISSNIFYLDHKIIQSDALNVSLKTQEIDVFFTLVTLFFDTQKLNSDYFQYSVDLNIIKENKDVRKYFRKSNNSKSTFNFSRELYKLRSQQSIHQIGSHVSRDHKDIFGFYKKFFKSIGVFSIAPHLSHKKKLLKKKQVKNRNLNFINSHKSSSFILQKPVILSDSFTFVQNQNLTNDSILLKVLRSYKNFDEKTESFLHNLKDTNLRENSRFLNFFWFSFPFYLYNINYVVSFVNSIILRHSFSLKKIFYKFFYFFYSFIFPSNNPSHYLRKTFFNFKDFSISDKKKLDPNFNKLLDSYLFILLSEKENQPEDSDLEKFSDSIDNVFGFLDNKKLTKNQLEKSKKRRKDKRFYARFSRKPNTVEYNRLISKKNVKILTEYNPTLYKKYPALKMLNLYKILEYFYFVITNDVDFYEGVTFAAKVALLRDKYGQAIVSDLLSKEDHKQAANVSVQMHYTDQQMPYFIDDSDVINRNTISAGGVILKDSENMERSDVLNTISNLSNSDEKIEMRKKFKYNTGISSSNMLYFSKNLLLSYRYRFRI